MIVPRPVDAKHKIQLFRLLKEILQDNFLANLLMFKGGTYAALRGLLDRFSIDLDFDLPRKEEKSAIRQDLHRIFKNLDYIVDDESRNYLQFFLKYPSPQNERNTLKLEINDDVSPANTYEKVHLQEIEMYCNGHTIDTMFANKLVAAMARFEKTGKIAGRDFYDLHVFFNKGFRVNKEVVEERTGLTYVAYLIKLTGFIRKHVDEKVLYEDINMLIPQDKLRKSVANVKDELCIFTNDEIKRT
jgi:predicted nucleotidyltransferase component of viral defense system